MSSVLQPTSTSYVKAETALPMPPPGMGDWSLVHVLLDHRRVQTDGVAVVCDDTRLGWGDLADRVARLAHGLRTRGVVQGDRLAWFGQNCHRLLELLLAGAHLGASVAPVNWRWSPAELAFAVDDLSPRVVVWQDQEIGDRVRKARDACNHRDALWVCYDGPEDAYEELLHEGALDLETLPSPAAELPALIIYTAAFEGNPNGAMLSQHNLLMQSLAVAATRSYTRDSVYLASGPLFHVGTFAPMLSTFHMGGTTVMLRRVEPDAICELIARERCTRAFLVDETIDRIVALNSDSRFDLSSLCSRSHSPEWDAMVTVIPEPKPSGYGQTEVSGWATYRVEGDEVLGRHGRPSPVHQLRIVDTKGNECGSGEIGEIVVRGPAVMAGYWNRPEVNARRRRGGWHYTNDMGRREVDGSLTFVGPKGRMIKSGVENIYPREVEHCIESHPAIQDCAVIGVVDARWGQTVKAIVVLEDEAAVTPDEIIEHCRERIGSYKKPAYVVFSDRLPRQGPSVDYDALDDMYGGGGYPGNP